MRKKIKISERKTEIKTAPQKIKMPTKNKTDIINFEYEKPSITNFRW
jgi:hypothetical protein